MKSIQVAHFHQKISSFQVFCNMSSFKIQIEQRNGKRYQTQASSIKVTNQSMTNINLVTLFKDFSCRKIINKMTNISKRKQRSLPMESLSCSLFSEQHIQIIMLPKI